MAVKANDQSTLYSIEIARQDCGMALWSLCRYCNRLREFVLLLSWWSLCQTLKVKDFLTCIANLRYLNLIWLHRESQHHLGTLSLYLHVVTLTWKQNIFCESSRCCFCQLDVMFSGFIEKHETVFLHLLLLFGMSDKHFRAVMIHMP